jgi:hypothetical protein
MGIDRNKLLDESPLLIFPSLAKAIGLNESIVIQQMHYWLNIAKKSGKTGVTYDNKVWIYNTFHQWEEQFPFWSVNTIKRIIKKLESNGLIEIAQLSKNKFDKTNYYTIKYNKYNGLFTHEQNTSHDDTNMIPSEEPNMILHDEPNMIPSEEPNMGPSLYDTENTENNYTKNTENKKNYEFKKNSDEFIKFINELSSLVNIPSKVKLIGEEVFNTITNKQLLKESYITHQLEKGDYAKSFINYMKDFNKFHSKNISPAVPKVENKYVLSCS